MKTKDAFKFSQPWCRGIMLVLTIVLLTPSIFAKPSEKLTADDARHLLNRTGFAASLSEVESFTGMTRQGAAEKLIHAARDVASTPAPKWTNAPIIPASKFRDMSREERETELKLNAERAFDLREWWFREMLTTSSPLTEKMTLFWHNHFATSQQKVKYTTLMYRQNVLLRKYALGNFGTLLHQIARDPAMLIYLDNANSRKEQPNENFAREVMELFTLGEGHYSENDIKEMARAFTGWSIDRENGEFMFRRGIHDAGAKTVFGKRGNFEGDQALDLLLKRPETALFITRKLWREFVSPTPEEKEVARWAIIYRDSGYSTATLMLTMLTSDAFYAADNRASLIKSPVEFVLGTLKLFDIETPNLRPFVLASALLGQNVFTPPNVKGWPGGEHWINSASLLGRKQFIDRLFRNEDRMEGTMNALDEMADRSGTPSPPGRVQRQQRNVERAMAALKWNLESWAKPYADRGGVDAVKKNVEGMSMLVLAVSPRELPTGPHPVNWARAMVADPAYQLK
ncbi:MAG: DUF1800 domain-containing protein [Pseudomonadota bacterium]